MSYYPAPGTPYVPQQPVNPYGGMGRQFGLSTPPAQHTDAAGAAATSAADKWATACSAVGTGRWLAARQTCFQQGRISGDTV